MFVLSNFLKALAGVLNGILQLFFFIVIARAILSWVSPDPYNPIVRFLHQVTDPLFYRVRRYVPLVGGGIDLSPIVIIFAIFFLQTFLVGTLYDLALAIR